MPAILSRPFGANLATRGNRVVAFLGDSVTAQGFGGSAALGFTFATVGFATWAAFLSRRRIELLPTSNFGISGQTSADVLARVDDALALNAGTVVVLCGTNDIGTLTAAQTISNLQRIYDRIERKNANIVAVCITPRGGLTANQYGRIHTVNRWIRAQRLARDNFFVVDAGVAYGDNATGIPKTTMSDDQLHPNGYGAWAIGNQVANILSVLYPDERPVFSNLLDVYSATDNPAGNLLASGVGLMVGTSGSLSNGPTGSLATGFSANGVNMPAGSTTVFAKVNKSDGRVFQQVTFGGNYNVASPGNLNITTASVHASCAAGDVLEASCELEVDAGQTNLAGVQLLLNVATPSGSPIAIDLATNNAGVLPPVAFSGIAKTPQIVLPANPTTVTAILRCVAKGVAGTSALAAVVRFGSLSIRKIN